MISFIFDKFSPIYSRSVLKVHIGRFAWETFEIESETYPTHQKLGIQTCVNTHKVFSLDYSSCYAYIASLLKNFMAFGLSFFYLFLLMPNFPSV